jgi:predicted nucleotidyltransferase
MEERARRTAELLTRLQRALAQGPSLDLVVLFGSAAAGTSRPDSDLDVAVLPAMGGLDAAEEAALCRRLALAGGADVDLIRLDRPVSTLLRWEIATAGVPILEAAPGIFARFQATAAAEYIDFAPALAYHGEIFRRRLLQQGLAR